MRPSRRLGCSGIYDRCCALVLARTLPAPAPAAAEAAGLNQKRNRFSSTSQPPAAAAAASYHARFAQGATDCDVFSSHANTTRSRKRGPRFRNSRLYPDDAYQMARTSIQRNLPCCMLATHKKTRCLSLATLIRLMRVAWVEDGSELVHTTSDNDTTWKPQTTVRPDAGCTWRACPLRRSTSTAQYRTGALYTRVAGLSMESQRMTPLALYLVRLFIKSGKQPVTRHSLGCRAHPACTTIQVATRPACVKAHKQHESAKMFCSMRRNTANIKRSRIFTLFNGPGIANSIIIRTVVRPRGPPPHTPHSFLCFFSNAHRLLAFLATNSCTVTGKHRIHTRTMVSSVKECCTQVSASLTLRNRHSYKGWHARVTYFPFARKSVCFAKVCVVVCLPTTLSTRPGLLARGAHQMGKPQYRQIDMTTYSSSTLSLRNCPAVYLRGGVETMEFQFKYV